MVIKFSESRFFSHSRIPLFLLLYSLSLKPALAVNPDSFDVSGMKIGQGIEEIRDTMKQFDKGIKFNEERWRPQPGVEESLSTLDAYIGQLSSDARFSYRLKAFFGQTTKTAYLVMQGAGQNIPDNEKTTYENLKVRMIEKFGTPIQEPSKGTASFVWVFDSKGQPDPKWQSGHCWNPNLLSGINDIKLNMQPTQGCGVVVAVRYTLVHNNPELIDSYQVAIFDHREVIKNIEAFNTLKDAAEKKRIEEERAKVAPNKPRI